ncbi:MAG: T9SS type A sorting domain-containing protein [Ignavibacteriaceae bacterium]|nr:T9SS type A sorting domain-containing protein [Ignavibacteriaceae bacterium]
MKKIIALTIFNFFSQRLIRLWRTFFICQIFLAINCLAQQPGWQVTPSQTTEELNSIFFYDYEVGFAVGDSGTVIKSIDSGKTWQVLQPPTTYDLNDLYMFHRDTILVVGDSGTMYFSDSGGVTWSGGSNYIPEDILSVSFSDGEGICGCVSQTILYCEYTGNSLTCMTVQTGLFGGGFYGAYMLSPQFGFVAGENSIFSPLLGRTTDSGLNWNFTAFYLNTNEGRATGVDFTDLNTGYVSASVWDGRGAISKTTDNGYNWETTFFTYPLRSIDFPISGASQVGYAVGSQGTILKTYDAGNGWVPQISGTTLKLNKVFFKDFDFGFAVGENGIILRTTTGGEPATNIENENQSLYSFELFQNFPNPFNPSTKIKFTVPQSPLLGGDGRGGLITLKVYDVLGNEIATLVNEEKPAGEYEVEFNASTINQHSSSGIYFYQLNAGSFIQTKKMVYLK